MAGDWIKMRTDLAEDPAVIAVAAALDCDEDMVVGKLHRLWSWADSQSRDGHATGVTQKWIDRHLCCDGFAAALVSVRWLAISEAGISFPNFERHNGETAKTRAQGTKRKQKQRSDPADNCPAHVPKTSRSERDKNETREEKRREEKKQEQGSPSETKAKALLMPSWLPPEVWADWHSFRNSQKGWTAKARALSLNTLSRLRDEGNDPRAVVDQSIERGWTGLFAVKNGASNGTAGSGAPSSAIERVKKANRDAGFDFN